MQSINRKEPQLRRISTIEAINKRKQEAPNIAPLGEISAEKIGQLYQESYTPIAIFSMVLISLCILSSAYFTKDRIPVSYTHLTLPTKA